MATDKNALLWAIRGIEDTDTLRVACEELERHLYALMHSTEYEVSNKLSDSLERASDALLDVFRGLPNHNTDLGSGLFKLA